MSTVIFFSVPLQGHINSSLSVVTELVRRGEQVFYYATAEFKVQIEATGALFRSYGPLDFAHQHFGDNAMRVLCAIANLVHPLLDRCISEARELQPDYIIHDTLAIWGRFVAEILALPTVGWQATLILMTQTTLRMPSLFLQPLLQHVAARAEVAATNKNLALLARTYHVSRVSVPDALWSFGDLTLVYTIRHLQPRHRIFNERFLFIGPSPTPRGDTSAFPFAQLTEKPIIYISLGTVFNDQLAFYHTCLQAFADRGLQVIMSVGERINLADLGSIPANFLIQTHVPQLEILPRCSLFITHGGLNSVMEALYHGVPMLLFPSKGGDQPWIALRVQQLGAGKILHSSRLTPLHLRTSAEALLSQSKFAQASAHAGAALRTMNGAIVACDAIERFKRNRSIPTE